MRYLLLIILFYCPFVFAQNDKAIHTSSLMLGVGGANQLDTYLSPQNYTGQQYSILHESLRMTRWAKRRVSYQGIFQGAFTYTRNAVGNAHFLGGHVGYNAAWHYNWVLPCDLRLMAGGIVGADVGFLFSERNGNNPANAKVKANLAASLMAIYNLHIRHYPIAIRYQINMPMMGVLFSPQFGQSYYEISQGNRDHNVCFAHPGNSFSLWQMLTFDFPVSKKIALRAGYLCDIRQSNVNNLKYHDRSHSFLIGFVRHFSLIRNKDRKEAIL